VVQLPTVVLPHGPSSSASNPQSTKQQSAQYIFVSWMSVAGNGAQGAIDRAQGQGLGKVVMQVDGPR